MESYKIIRHSKKIPLVINKWLQICRTHIYIPAETAVESKILN